jgi:ABC-type lipoprotein export system ATPase subunit
MQILNLQVRGLFKRFNHDIDFPVVAGENAGPSVVILYGPNGVGKTTVLRMLDAFLRERRGGAWDVFRTVPFESCTIRISEIPPFTIRPADAEGRPALQLEFDGTKALVGRDVEARGGITPADEERSTLMSARFEQARQPLSFEFIQTARLQDVVDADTLAVLHPGTGAYRYWNESAVEIVSGVDASERSLRRALVRPLSSRMAQFISFAQLDYRSFFDSSEPGLFPRVIERLTVGRDESVDVPDLLSRLRSIQTQDAATDRLGLERDHWDYQELERILLSLREGEARKNALAVTSQFIEVLESRAAERALIAERLFTFEKVMAEFFSGKRVVVTSREGLRIETEDGSILNERDLSSGERHLLYLMVSAVVARRRGTVIAIDEPEMSMHIAWQRKLIPALLKCAAKAEPQFILATHSPDLAANYTASLIELK